MESEKLTTSNTGKRSKKISKEASSQKKTKENENFPKSKRSVEGKAKRKSISYEYQMISRKTWEYAEVFKNIESWHESIKGDEIDTNEQTRENEKKNSIGDEPQALLEENLFGKQEQYKDDSDSKHTFSANGKSSISEESILNKEATSCSKSSTDLVHDISHLRHIIATDGRHSTENGEAPLKDDQNVANLNDEGSNSALEDITSEIFSSKPESVKKTYTCTICKKVLRSKTGYKYHLLIHSGRQPYKCAECPKMFSQSGNLKDHQRIHTGSKPYKCTDCPKTFSQSSHLSTHQRIHSGSKPYKCTECPTTFSLSSNLTRHQRIHSGSKPYKCTECPKTFSQSSHLSTHQRIHSGSKPYKCTECPTTFSLSSNLTRHQRIHSRSTPYKCEDC